MSHATSIAHLGDDDHVQYNSMGDLIPEAIACVKCFAQWYIKPSCRSCCGTGREPAPFSEVWGE